MARQSQRGISTKPVDLTSWDQSALCNMKGLTGESKKTMNQQEIKLTDEQIENWRAILCLTLGPFALVAPREEIQKIANTMQNLINQGQIRSIPDIQH